MTFIFGAVEHIMRHGQERTPIFFHLSRYYVARFQRFAPFRRFFHFLLGHSPTLDNSLDPKGTKGFPKNPRKIEERKKQGHGAAPAEGFPAGQNVTAAGWMNYLGGRIKVGWSLCVSEGGR